MTERVPVFKVGDTSIVLTDAQWKHVAKQLEESLRPTPKQYHQKLEVMACVSVCPACGTAEVHKLMDATEPTVHVEKLALCHACEMARMTTPVLFAALGRIVNWYDLGKADD